MAKTKKELNQLKQEYETVTAKLKELSEDELIHVTGGTNREKTIVVKVTIIDCGPYEGEVSIAPYLNGTLLSNQVKKVDESFEYVNILVKGTGLATLTVKINNKAIKNYTINFDKGNYSQI